jgi:hypothetical protein
MANSSDDLDDFLNELDSELNSHPRTKLIKCGYGFHEVEVPLSWKLKAWCPGCIDKAREKYLKAHGIRRT